MNTKASATPLSRDELADFESRLMDGERPGVGAFDRLLATITALEREGRTWKRRYDELERAGMAVGLSEGKHAAGLEARIGRLEGVLRRIAGDTQHEAQVGEEEDAETICGLCAMGIDDHDPGCLIGIARAALK